MTKLYSIKEKLKWVVLCCYKRRNSNWVLINTGLVAQAGTFCMPLPLENLTGIRDTKVRSQTFNNITCGFHTVYYISFSMALVGMFYHIIQCGRSHTCASYWKNPIKSRLDNGKKVGSAKAYYWLQRMPLPALLIRVSSQLFKANISRDVTSTANTNKIQKDEHNALREADATSSSTTS